MDHVHNFYIPAIGELKMELIDTFHVLLMSLECNVWLGSQAGQRAVDTGRVSGLLGGALLPQEGRAGGYLCTTTRHLSI